MCTLPWQSLLFHCVYLVMIDCCQDSNILFAMRKCSSKEKGNSAKDNSDDEDDLKVYASMAWMSNDDVSKSKDYGDSSQLTNWILDSGATCHMTPEVKDFIPGSL